jgi:hypothetical protein
MGKAVGQLVHIKLGIFSHLITSKTCFYQMYHPHPVTYDQKYQIYVLYKIIKFD